MASIDTKFPKDQRSPNSQEMAVLQDGTKIIIGETTEEGSLSGLRGSMMVECGILGSFFVSTWCLFKALFKIIGGEIWDDNPLQCPDNSLVKNGILGSDKAVIRQRPREKNCVDTSGF